MIEKIAPYSMRTVKNIGQSGLNVKISKLLGNDGKATGYMTLAADETVWKKLAEKKIYVYTLTWKTDADTEWNTKKRRPKSPEPTKGFMKFVKQQIELTAPQPHSEEREVAVIVKAKNGQAEELLDKKGRILAIAPNGYIKVVYPKKDWLEGDCFNFKVICKFFKGKWRVNTKMPYKSTGKEPTFDDFLKIMNSEQETRFADSVYDGFSESRNAKGPGYRKYPDAVIRMGKLTEDIMKKNPSISAIEAERLARQKLLDEKIDKIKDGK